MFNCSHATTQRLGPLDTITIDIDENISISSEVVVKALGVYIDNKFTFNQHVKQCCAKAARQLNLY